MINLSKIQQIESDLKIRFPMGLREIYLNSPAGQPERSFYSHAKCDIGISEFLPLEQGDRGEMTAVEVYKDVILTKAFLSNNFFPFAIDSGGDILFVDCSKEDGPVVFFRTEYWPDEKERAILKLDVGIKDFWDSLEADNE